MLSSSSRMLSISRLDIPIPNMRGEYILDNIIVLPTMKNGLFL